MSVRDTIPVKVLDKDLAGPGDHEGTIQGAGVQLRYGPDFDHPSITRSLTTDSFGLAIFIVEPGVYGLVVNAPGYATEIEDEIGKKAPYLIVDTQSAGTQYPVFARMTRDE